MPESQQLKIGAAYIRVSTDDQMDLSPESQLDEIIKYAKEHSIVIPQEFIFMESEGRSGKKADNRPRFQKMIAIAKSTPRPFDCILVWKFSRFARNQDESTFYKGMLRKKLNIDVISITEPVLDGMYGRLIEMIIEWQDEFYSYNLAQDVTRGMKKKAQLGGYQSTTPLGYQYNGPKSIPTIIEPEAIIIRDIFAQYINGMDCTTIARRLNDCGYKTKRGNSFEYRVVLYILKNPFYVGKIRWNRAPHSAYQENPKEEIIVADGQHEPIISQDTFNQVQKMIPLKNRAVKARSVSTCAHWLSGLLKCPICGASLSFNKSKCDNFQCWRYAKGYHEGSSSVSARKATLALLESLSNAIGTQTLEYEYIPQHGTANTSRESFLSTELERISIKEKRIHDAYEAGIDTLAEYGTNKQRLAKEQEQILKELSELTTEAVESRPTQKEVMRRVLVVYDIVSDPDVDYVIKGNAIRSILKKILYDRDSGSFQFTYYM